MVQSLAFKRYGVLTCMSSNNCDTAAANQNKETNDV